MFSMVYNGSGACGYIGHGIIRPGEVVQVRSEIPLHEDTESAMIVCCRDPFGDLHTWTSREDHAVVKKAKLEAGFLPGNLEDRIKQAYPDLNLGTIEWVGHEMSRAQ